MLAFVTPTLRSRANTRIVAWYVAGCSRCRDRPPFFLLSSSAAACLEMPNSDGRLTVGGTSGSSSGSGDTAPSLGSSDSVLFLPAPAPAYFRFFVPD